MRFRLGLHLFFASALALFGCGPEAGTGADDAGSPPDARAVPMPDAAIPDAAATDAAPATDSGIGEPDAGRTALASCSYAATDLSSRILDTNTSATTLSFSVPGLPEVAAVERAVLRFSSYDADHPGQEGTIQINGSAPLDLPADPAWDNSFEPLEVDVTSLIVAGTNTVVFGPGALPRSYYGVGEVRLELRAYVEECTPVIEPPPPTGDVVELGLQSAYAFDEGAGTTLRDLRGPRDATVHGSTWEAGGLVHRGEEDYVEVPRGSLLEGAFTIDLWFSADGIGDRRDGGRVLSASTSIGGSGPEWFLRPGLKLGFRANNRGAVWDPPELGLRTNSGPPDHWAEGISGLPTRTLVHLVITHEPTSRRFSVWQGTDDFALIFRGTYSGDYTVSVANLRLGRSHHPTAPGHFPGRYEQLLIYDRVLAEAEVMTNHVAGPSGI